MPTPVDAACMRDDDVWCDGACVKFLGGVCTNVPRDIPAASKRRFEHEACLAVPKGDNCVMRRADSRLAVSRGRRDLGSCCKAPSGGAAGSDTRGRRGGRDG